MQYTFFHVVCYFQNDNLVLPVFCVFMKQTRRLIKKIKRYFIFITRFKPIIIINEFTSYHPIQYKH